MSLPPKDSLEYECLIDVQSEIRDMCIIDLSRYVTRLKEDYTKCLYPAPTGVYIQGRLEPILEFSPQTAYYTLTQYKEKPAIPNILTYADFMASREVVVSRGGRAICPPPKMMRNVVSEECSFNYSAVYLTFIAVWEYLRGLHSQTYPTTNVSVNKIREANFVLPELREAFDEADQPDLGALLELVEKFIGRDYCSVYHLKLQNTTLQLEKGNDYRVIAYYKSIFDKYDELHVQEMGF